MSKEYISPDAADALPAWVSICGTLAPMSSILMFLSPIPTIRQVLRTGTVGDLPLLPYTSMVTSCFVWILYGILKREPTIWGTNLVEFTLSVYYFVEFTNYAPKQSPTFPGSVYHHIQLACGTWGVSLFIALFFSSRVTTIGDITVLLTVLTFASPLAAVKAVIEHQSSEAIPWPFTLAALLNCCLWTIVGVFEMHDVYVYTPAVLGLLFSLVQVALKLYFGDHQSNTEYTRAPTAPVEMPYPVLEKVRQVVLLGSHLSNISNNPYHDRSMENHDLHLDMFSGGGNSDYVELGVPLTGGGGGGDASHQHAQQQHHQVATPSFSSPHPQQQQPFGATNHLQYSHNNINNNHKHSRSGEGLESVVFDDSNGDNNNALVPPFPPSSPESFRSRSGSHTGAVPGQHNY